jgi:hypothetical protein
MALNDQIQAPTLTEINPNISIEIIRISNSINDNQSGGNGH